MRFNGPLLSFAQTYFSKASFGMLEETGWDGWKLAILIIDWDFVINECSI